MAEYAEIINGKVNNIIIADSSPGADWMDVTSVTVSVDGGTDKVAFNDSYDSSTQTFTRTINTATLEENEEKAKLLLAESDWTVLADVGLTDYNVLEWKTYRASLRAIAKAPSAGQKSWPTMPDKEYL